MIEAVLFDGDQTLWDFEKVMHDALVAVLEDIRAARPGPFTDALTWEELARHRTEVGEELEGVEYDLARLRVLGFGRTLAHLRAAEGGDESADAELAERVGSSYFTYRDRDPALFADTRPCLDALHGRYRLGLLSNGSRLPETVGLDGYFECVVFAQDHRVAKPDKGLFEVVERRLGLGPAACVLVGDHPLNDVIGAKRAGWHAVWLDRDRQGAQAFLRLHPAEERPDAVVSSLAELPGDPVAGALPPAGACYRPAPATGRRRRASAPPRGRDRARSCAAWSPR
jgi:HAD superfamily hydrolase (TIGR01509 family)